ncbi:DUF2214 family protein [Mesorhizobium ciceri]|uniref:DUF2214 family protein n=1 Tax=Mesorhizobium ciceri biovar biserrulae (strain HAMBI 2942 / LMG 23838 / WSM1271) TaxID=765698 RepID=E8TCS7_MESCW|nr:DUF2214 family protein [Mesorhizobium ciceri]ADV10919.1 Protein of unknown function DUF2214, membrane [Mesorhizobium ciceri biovar biserrulae WSM1271]
MDTTDLVLAIFHHLLVFSLAGIIGAEFVLIRGDLGAATLKRLAGIDRHYGVIAALIIVVGIGRVFYGLKGWEFYVYNWVFWAKIAAFGAVGLLSIIPAVRFISWNRQASGNASFQVPATELASVKDLYPRRSFHLPAHPGLRRGDGARLRLLGWRSPSDIIHPSSADVCGYRQFAAQLLFASLP